MAFDNHALLAYDVVSGTDPGTIGTSLSVSAGKGATFPAAPFNILVWPPNTAAILTNSEVVRVTAKSTDTFTIARAQEGTSAKNIVAGWNVSNSITPKVITDLEAQITTNDTTVVHLAGAETITGLKTTTSGLILTSTATNGIMFYNSSDQTTNFERATVGFVGNTFTIATANGGTGTLRPMTINGASSFFTMTGSGVSFGRGNTTNAIIATAQATFTSSSIVQSLMLVQPTLQQTGTAGYTALLVNPLITTVGSGSQLLADFQLGSTSKLSIDNTGSLNLSTTANEYHYNLGDPTATNYERARAGWVSNVFQFVTEIGGTGLGRNMVIGTVNRRLAIVESPSSSGIFQFAASTSVVGAVGVVVNGTMTQSSGSVTPLAVTATMQQTGTAGYTGFLVNVNETTIGNGSKLLADFQIGGTTKASIDNIGVVKAFGYSTVFANRVTTTNLSAGSSAVNYCDATAGVFTITLPTPTSTSGVAFMIKKTDAVNTVTVATAAGTIDGATTYSLSTQYKYIVVRSNGSNWFIEGNN